MLTSCYTEGTQKVNEERYCKYFNEYFYFWHIESFIHSWYVVSMFYFMFVWMCVYLNPSGIFFWNIVMAEDYYSYWSCLESCDSSCNFIKNVKNKTQVYSPPCSITNQNRNFQGNASRDYHIITTLKNIFLIYKVV